MRLACSRISCASNALRLSWSPSFQLDRCALACPVQSSASAVLGLACHFPDILQATALGGGLTARQADHASSMPSRACSGDNVHVQVCLQRAQELLLGIEALVPIVKALQCTHLRASHWERLQGLVGGLPAGPESDVTLLQLTGVHVSSLPSPLWSGPTPGSAAGRLCCGCMYMHGCLCTTGAPLCWW